jgi:hypothetical protein
MNGIFLVLCFIQLDLVVIHSLLTPCKLAAAGRSNTHSLSTLPLPPSCRTAHTRARHRQATLLATSCRMCQSTIALRSAHAGPMDFRTLQRGRAVKPPATGPHGPFYGFSGVSSVPLFEALSNMRAPFRRS